MTSSCYTTKLGQSALKKIQDGFNHGQVLYCIFMFKFQHDFQRFCETNLPNAEHQIHFKTLHHGGKTILKFCYFTTIVWLLKLHGSSLINWIKDLRLQTGCFDDTQFFQPNVFFSRKVETRHSRTCSRRFQYIFTIYQSYAYFCRPRKCSSDLREQKMQPHAIHNDCCSDHLARNLCFLCLLISFFLSQIETMEK